MDNIIESGDSIIVINGGDPLEGCPKDYNIANSWADTANEGKDRHNEPIWSFDCGFKLDFDGPILSVSSRFYPPKTHYGPKWDGTVTVLLLDRPIVEKEFKCDTLQQIKEEVELYIKDVASWVPAPD